MTMNGLTVGEVKALKAIQALARTDLPAAKQRASAWVRANKQRRARREMACHRVRGLYS